MTTIGNRSSALQRIEDYAEEFRRCMRRRPDLVILFAEDYDAIKDVAERLSKRKKMRIIRGPSIAEYR